MIELPWGKLLPTEDGSLGGLRLRGLPESVAGYIAMEPSGRRHFLVGIPSDAAAIEDHATHGLRVSTRDWTVGDGARTRFVDLTCLDGSLNDTFDAVVREIALNLSKSSDDPRRGVVDALARWRRFWRADHDGLSPESQLGLFGELWFLSRWMRPLTADKFAAWFGAEASRHDFQAPFLSVEVKTTASREGATVHRVGSLDQLADPESGELYLFGLHAVEDHLASNSLPGLVEGLRSAAAEISHETLDVFEGRLAAVGYSPAHANRYQRPLRVSGEALYRVDDSFPRLTADSFVDGVPSAIADVSYFLVAEALDAWRIATRPSEASLLFADW